MQYPELGAHHQLLTGLVNSIRNTLLRIKAGHTYNPIEILRFQNFWLIDHILEKDALFRKYYRRKASSSDFKAMDAVQWLKSRLTKLIELCTQKTLSPETADREKTEHF